MTPIANRLTVRHLRLVAAITTEGNLLRTANSLNITQSAVTKALQDAEAQMGVTLFERTNRGVKPTMFGTSLAAHARLIIARIDKAEQELTNLRDGTVGRVAVGTLLAGSAGLLALRSFRAGQVLMATIISENRFERSQRQRFPRQVEPDPL